MALGAAQMGIVNIAELEAASRELTAVARATAWLNSQPLSADALAGRVILVQFWTYTCINWLRTLPYVRMWSQRFGRELLVLGVHTPEFAFEHNIENVRRAIRQLRVGHPIVIDNDYSIWRAFGNNYWPALYFVDARGRIRDRHFGEGRYDQSERALQRLLVEAGVADAAGPVIESVDATGVEAQADWAALRSPENYLGYERTENFASPTRHLVALD
jgi:thiol-disulfide isomerase/thioredoxin